MRGVSPPSTTYNIYAPTISKLETAGLAGTATLEWPRPSSVSRWERVAFDSDKDGETVEMYVETSSDGGSTWSTWEPDGDGNARPVAPGTDLSSIPPGDHVRLRAELSRTDITNNPRLTLASRQWRP